MTELQRLARRSSERLATTAATPGLATQSASAERVDLSRPVSPNLSPGEPDSGNLSGRDDTGRNNSSNQAQERGLDKSGRTVVKAHNPKVVGSNPTPATIEALVRSTFDCYRPGKRAARAESDRFHRFSYDDLIARDKASLDIFWLRDESLEDTDNLPSPGVIAAEIVEDLEAALAEFTELAESLQAIEEGASGT